jgi:predicted secreted protein
MSLSLFRAVLAACAVSSCCAVLPAHAQALPQPENIVQLAASATVEVPQDWLSIELQAVRTGPDAGQVQAELKAVLEAALANAKRSARAGAVEVSTGSMAVMPRYGRDQRIASWAGTATLVVEGADIAAVSEVAGRLQGLNVTRAGFRLGRAARDRAEQDVQAQAIARFRAKATEVARSFGFTGYVVREVSVSLQDGGGIRPMFAAARAKSDFSESADAPVPVEAGKTPVTVQVSGSIQLR